MENFHNFGKPKINLFRVTNILTFSRNGKLTEMKFTKNTHINALPEQVFDFIDDSANLPQIWRNLSNIRNLRRIENGGTSFEFDYTMTGTTLHGTSEDIEYDRPRRIVTRTTGGINSTLEMIFSSGKNGTGTDLTLIVEYDIPIPLLGQLAEVVVAKLNESDIVFFLTHLMLKFK
jgi:carbon monoxide dehydrogenase subunit G